MPIDLGRRLIAAGVVVPEEVEAALFLSVVRGVPFARALVDRGALSERGLEDELGRRGGLALRNVVGVGDLIAQLPRAMCRRLCAVPVRLDPYTGTVDVAAADPLDGHIAREFGFHLSAPIRIIRAPMTAIEETIRRVELDDTTPPSGGRPRRATPAFPHGAPKSSVPPPPLEEVPIPLVRRAGVPLIDPETEEPRTRRRGSDAAPAAALRQIKTLQSEKPTPVEGTRAVRQPPPRALHELAVEPPSVSFPSSPPPPPDDDAGVETLRRGSIGRPGIRAEVPGPITRSFGGEIEDELTHELDDRRTIPSEEPPVSSTDLAAPAAAPEDERPTLVGSGAPAAEPARAEGPPPLPFAEPGVVLKSLRESGNRDDVVRNALHGLRLVARRVGVFVIKRDGFHGWACNPELGEAAAFRRVVIPQDQPSVLATATAASIYLGPIPPTTAHAALLAVMGRASSDVAAIAVRAGGRPAMILLADELGDTLTGTRRMDELARATGEALGRLLVARPSGPGG